MAGDQNEAADVRRKPLAFAADAEVVSSYMEFEWLFRRLCSLYDSSEQLGWEPWEHHCEILLWPKRELLSVRKSFG
jgi:hypothetical protein